MGRRIDPSWGGPIKLFLVTVSAPTVNINNTNTSDNNNNNNNNKNNNNISNNTNNNNNNNDNNNIIIINNNNNNNIWYKIIAYLYSFNFRINIICVERPECLTSNSLTLAHDLTAIQIMGNNSCLTITT